MKPWHILGILLACLALAGCLLPQEKPGLTTGAGSGWTMDGDSVYWTSNGYTIRAYPATSHEMTSHTQYVNFSSTNPTPLLVNLSFVFDVLPTSGSISIWRNTSHSVLAPRTVRLNSTYLVVGVMNYSATTAPCMLGDSQNLFSFNVTYNDGNGTKTGIACFDSYTNIGSNYTLKYSYNDTVYDSATQYWMDWNDILSEFHYTNISDHHIWTIDNVPFNGSTNYITKFQYDVRGSGKFDIYAHTGSPAEVVAGTATTFVVLDPWWNGTYIQRLPKNDANCSATGLGFLPVNGSYVLNGTQQWANARCYASSYLYFNDKSTQAMMADNMTQFPFDCVNCSATSYLSKSVYNATPNLIAFYNMENASDGMEAYNLSINGTVSYLSGIMANGMRTSGDNSRAYAAMGVMPKNWTMTGWFNITGRIANSTAPGGCADTRGASLFHWNNDTTDVSACLFVQNVTGTTAFATNWGRDCIGNVLSFYSNAYNWGSWSMWSLVYNGTNLSMYLNGTYMNDSRNNGVGTGSCGTTNIIGINGYGLSSSAVYGSIEGTSDYVAVFNSSLNASTLRTIYNETAWAFAKTVGYGSLSGLEFHENISVKYSAGITGISFRPIHAFATSVQPVNQSSTVPLFNVSVYDSTPRMVNISQTPAITGFTVKCAPNYNQTGVVILTATPQRIVNTTYPTPQSIWCWADFHNPTAGLKYNISVIQG